MNYALVLNVIYGFTKESIEFYKKKTKQTKLLTKAKLFAHKSNLFRRKND